MISDDNERNASGKPKDAAAEKDGLGIQLESLSGNPSLRSRSTVDIEKELNRALDKDDAALRADIPDAEMVSDIPPAKKRGGVGALTAPALVLAVSAVAAGYIILHPEVLGRKSADAPATVASAPADSAPIVLAEADGSTPPQTASIQNEAPDTAAAAADAAPAVPPPPAAVPVDVTATPQGAAPDQASAEPAPATAPSPAMAEAPTPAGDIKLAQADVPAAPPALSPMPVESSAGGPAPAAPGVAGSPQPDPAALRPTGAAASTGDILTPAPPMDAKPDSMAVSGKTEKVTKIDTSGQPEQYYDSTALTPSGRAPGPRKVDPSIEPGQKLVVVEGVRKAGDTESIIVSADRAMKLEKYDAALDMYNTLYTKNHRDPRVLMGRAVAQQHLGMNDAAIDSYQQFLDVAPDNADAMVNLLGLLKQNDPAGALQRMVGLQGRFPAHAGLAAQTGIAEGEAGNYQDAMRYLGKAMSLEPSNPQHPFNMAVLADRQGDTAAAIKSYEQALQISSTAAGGQTIPRETIYDRLAVLRRR